MQAAAAAASLGGPAGTECAGGGPCPQQPRGAAGPGLRHHGTAPASRDLPRPSASGVCFSQDKRLSKISSARTCGLVSFRSVPMEIYRAAADRIGSHRHLLMVEQPCKNGGYLFCRKASANPFKVRPVKNTLCLKDVLGLVRLRWYNAGLFGFLN